jgi:hexosaminidase
LAGE